jgi:hypothetical protein
MRTKKLFMALTVLLFILISSPSVYPQGSNLRLSGRVTVNGISDEWDHNLVHYNRETKLNYAIANDAYNLYILIESADQPTTARILENSVTVSINSKGRKKEVTSLSFPIIEREEFVRNRAPFTAARNQGQVQPNSFNKENDILSTANTIQISGFYKIPDGIFSLDLVNTYGIKAASKVDQKKVLVYELSIPLSRLNVSVSQKRPVAYNIKINGSSRNNFSAPDIATRGTRGTGRIPVTGGIPQPGFPGIDGGMNPYPRIGNGGTINLRPGPGITRGNRGNFSDYNIEMKAVDFWVKYHLAKTKL